MHKFSLLLVIIFLLTSVSSHSFRPELPTRLVDVEQNACSMDNVAFQAGEEFTFKLFYNWNFVWLSAGEVTFRVRDLGDQLHLSAHGRTFKSYEWFYKVYDKYDTYIDKKTMLPIVSVRDIQEGKYRLYDKIIFDQYNRKAKSLRGKTITDATWSNYDMDGCMHDILSIIYYTRNMSFDELQPGDSFPVKLFVDKKIWELGVKYKGRQEHTKIKGLGSFKTINFSPEVISDGHIFKDDTQMDVWVSDDANRLPLLIESPVSVGSVKAVLSNYKGLRHEFTAAND